mmetsp:Transcript_23524/g.64852  ORF Transcript_23524/g.64852 Transcript_23524/m.64852 type:complete len:254 (-) Transcript_23524:359-1120(-)|eukprot:CAMPEP_0202340722 /NCGR_PEP_ID=MMETSP1126-20121109/2037_1 /ASSEMBLY_ACC=CAM_ASM_000457 /TAXON_ID=3047 /ORGANISM="Dunaliella tertiolecta, Strain CCMP1320" /LENGTH=253 /DNA_ID=CAMNT_0048931463 /DNA_START=1651 /DNA_END=2412 /DNA_ORIENTATION=-
MDWGNVSTKELVEAIRDASSWGRPRPLRDFFGKFSVPRDVPKWIARLKANAFYYRASYVLLCVLCAILLLVRSLSTLLALVLLTLAVLCGNDSFAGGFNDKLLRVVRRIHPPSALKLRARASAAQPEGSLGSLRGRGKKRLFILMLPRWAAAAGMLLAGALLLNFRWSIREQLVRMSFAWAFMLLHMTFRSPNLKARFTSARDEFQAVWRDYQMKMSGGAGMGMPPMGGMGFDGSQILGATNAYDSQETRYTR